MLGIQLDFSFVIRVGLNRTVFSGYKGIEHVDHLVNSVRGKETQVFLCAEKACFKLKEALANPITIE